MATFKMTNAVVKMLRTVEGSILVFQIPVCDQLLASLIFVSLFVVTNTLEYMLKNEKCSHRLQDKGRWFCSLKYSSAMAT